MLLYEENTEIIIWGTGNLGKRLYHKYKNNYSIQYFVDNNEHNNDEYLYGTKVFKYSLENDKKYKILIASTFWKEISLQLISYGFELHKNFCPYWMFEYENIDYFNLIQLASEEVVNNVVNIMKKEKKVAIIHGNCQTTLIQSYLQKNSKFIEKYVFVNIPRVCSYSKDELEIIKKQSIWESCSLFITQNISKDNRFGAELATKSICDKLKPKCKVLTITNIYFDGYFPQMIKNKNNILTDIHNSGLFTSGDKYIDELFFYKCDTEEIINKISDDNFFSKEFINEQVEKSFEKLFLKEEKCNIKMLDYIQEHYIEQQLFYSPNHPTNFLIKECTIRILKYLGIEDVSFEDEQIFDLNISNSLRGQDIVIYPAVIKALNMKQWEKIYYPNRYLIDNYYCSFNKYVADYIQMCLKK